MNYNTMFPYESEAYFRSIAAMQQQAYSPLSRSSCEDSLRTSARLMLELDPSRFSEIMNEVVNDYNMKLAIARIDIENGIYP